MNNLLLADRDRGTASSKNLYLLLALISTFALVCTFLVSNSGYEFTTKTIAFLLIGVTYLLVAAGLYFKVARHEAKRDEIVSRRNAEDKRDSKNVFSQKVEEKLLVFDEANNFFSASLRADDMFRLVSSRIAEIVEYKTCTLFLIDEENGLKASFAYGANSRMMTRSVIGCDEGIAGKAFISGEIERDEKLELEKKAMPLDALNGLKSAISVPLTRGEEIFGVMVLYDDFENAFGGNIEMLLNAIGERVAPLLISSFSFEQNISKAMTDSLTNLPNERAFYLVLENQIAEAQRFHGQRPLTIMVLDIRDFADFNRRFGFSTGDNLLAFASGIIKAQLRKMDFLSRSMNDEFWIVLPTASNEVTEKVKLRIEKAFSKKQFNLRDDKSHLVRLNFASATFLQDGETANQLLQRAILRKKQSKSDKENTVIMFPKEYVN